jgi:zinc ribbon protein
MIVCPECGTRNPAGTQFCGECGTFLEWAGDDPGKSTATTTQTAHGGGTATATPVSPPKPDLPPEPPAPEPPQPVETKPEPPRPPEPERLAPRPPEPAPRPVTEPAPADTGIRLVQPDAKQRRYNRETSDEPATETPGDIECANCGVGNIATRKFCRSCGHLLARPAAEQKPSWWRRLWNRITGKGRQYEAGTRRVRRSGGGGIRGLIALLAVGGVGVAAFTVLPTRYYLNRAITAFRDRSADPVPARPTEVSASSSLSGTRPSRIADGLTNEFWAPARGQGPAGQWVEGTFEQPVRLLNVIITSGISEKQDKFVTQSRPHDVIITTTDEDNEQKTFPLVVQDKPGPQTYEVKVSNVKKVRLTVISCYDARRKNAVCAIGEIEYLKRG